MKLICPECRHENEAERIYCHDCGARLDRSALAKTKAREEDPKETQRRLQSMLHPKGARMRHRLLQTGKLLLAAVAAAALVQMFRAPQLPEKSAAGTEMPSQINLELEDAATAPPVGPPLRYSEEEVNAYMANRLKSKRKALSEYVQFERAAVQFEEGFAHATVERSLFGFSLFTSVAFAPRIEGGAVVAKVRAGKIGRLPVHPAVMQYAGFLFSDVRSVFDRERKSIAKLGAIELHPDAVVFLRKGAAAAPSAPPGATPPAAATPVTPETTPLPQPAPSAPGP